MHPVIRLLSLLVLAAFAPWLPGIALLVTGSALLAWGVARPATGRAMWHGVRRVRWLLLSLTVLYFWFSPGQPVLPALGAVSPTATGAMLAIRHAGVLLVMVCAAVALLAGLRPAELVAALRALLVGPLRTSITLRFANRAGLLFAELPHVERRMRESLRQREAGLAERAASLLRSVEREAERTRPGFRVESVPVPRQQWLLPPLLTVAGWLTVFPPEAF